MADISTIDANCSDIDGKRDSKRRELSYFGVAGESGGTFQTFREEEIAELLPKKVARIAEIDRGKPAFFFFLKLK